MKKKREIHGGRFQGTKDSVPYYYVEYGGARIGGEVSFEAKGTVAPRYLRAGDVAAMFYGTRVIRCA